MTLLTLVVDCVVGLSDPMLMSEDAELLFASLPLFCSCFSLSFASVALLVHMVQMRIGYASLRVRFGSLLGHMRRLRIA